MAEPQRVAGDIFAGKSRIESVLGQIKVLDFAISNVVTDAGEKPSQIAIVAKRRAPAPTNPFEGRR